MDGTSQAMALTASCPKNIHKSIIMKEVSSTLTLRRYATIFMYVGVNCDHFLI